MADGDYERGRDREIAHLSALLKHLKAERPPFLILASGSPRRAKIVAAEGIAFRVVKTDVPEVSFPEDPERTVLENARAKYEAARAMPEIGREVPILAADTIVWHDGKIYGKPRDDAEARQFLKTLSGVRHTVYTGVVLNGVATVHKTDVIFRPLADETIAEYVRKVHPIDRAGAYDIDESGDLLVERIEGSYENVMGLPREILVDFRVENEKNGIKSAIGA